MLELSCVGLSGQVHTSCENMFSSFFRWSWLASLVRPLPACLCSSILQLWSAGLPFIHLQNLTNDFSLQILLFFPVNKLHSFFLCKSYSKTLTLTLFSFLASSDKLCPLEQPPSLFHLFFGRDLSEATLLNPLASITSHLCEHWSAWGAESIRSARSQVGWGKVFH